MSILEISAVVKFDSIEEARAAGQAVEQLLRIQKQGKVRLYDFTATSAGKRPSKASHPLYLPEPPSNVTKGRQEVETRLMNLTKNVRNTFGENLPQDANIGEEVMVLDGKQWIIDYQRLFDNVARLLVEESDRKELKVVFDAAVALTLQQEVTGRVK